MRVYTQILGMLLLLRREQNAFRTFKNAAFRSVKLRVDKVLWLFLYNKTGNARIT